MQKVTQAVDLAIVGGGIVGVATAAELANRFPSLRLLVVEKEKTLAHHQTGHNSGVIHSGIYYTPGSLKAKLCVEGFQMTYDYCNRKGIPYNKCGKLIVATNEKEIPLLDDLFDKGTKNSAKDLKIVGPEEIKEIEPNCKAIKALHAPHTGIVDFGEISRSLAKDFEAQGGTILTESKVNSFKIAAETPTTSEKESIDEFPVVVGIDKKSPIRCRNVITCAGLHSDRIAVLSGCSPFPKIIPFRGEYLLLKKDKSDLVNGNIYPVPNPDFPFLGVHFTPRMNGDVWVGPNAVLAFKREGYSYSDISVTDLIEEATFSGLWRIAWKYKGYGFDEFRRSVSTSAQVRQAQNFVPSLQPGDVTRGPSGVRAQAMEKDGTLVDDFVFDSGSGELGKRMIHVRNAPSPAATSAMAIAKMIVEQCTAKFGL